MGVRLFVEAAACKGLTRRWFLGLKFRMSDFRVDEHAGFYIAAPEALNLKP